MHNGHITSHESHFTRFNLSLRLEDAQVPILEKIIGAVAFTYVTQELFRPPRLGLCICLRLLIIDNFPLMFS